MTETGGGVEEAAAADFEGWYLAQFAAVEAALIVAAGDGERGREAAAEAFARALERWDRVGTMANPAGWVYRVGVNQLRRGHRRRLLERRAHDRAGARAEATRPPAVLVEMSLDLWTAVAALPRRQRTAVALRYVADLTERDVAAAMGVSPGTVARHLHGARQALNRRLTDTLPIETLPIETLPIETSQRTEEP